MTKFRKLTFILSLATAAATTFPARGDIQMTKQAILKLAESFQGQGDPDHSKQQALEKLVTKLLKENPQPPLRERLPLLYGAWKQVWGPYDYRSNKRGVDPALDPTQIVQVIFEGGYYYNVNPTRGKNLKPKGITLLRGEFVPNPKLEDRLNVRFTNLRRIKGPLTDKERLQDLPRLSESRTLPGERTVLPGFIVKLFFGGGTLHEVYTDEDMRITFGSGRNGGPDYFIYILTRLPGQY